MLGLTALECPITGLPDHPNKPQGCGQQNLSKKNGAGTRIRTTDFLITNEALYQLSYTGTGARV